MNEEENREVTTEEIKPKVSVGRKILGFLSGMKLSIALLLIILAACVAGSVITQGQSNSYYLETYGARGARLILGLNLDHVFTCVWFLILTALLLLNLVLCSIIRFPNIKKRYKEGYSLEKRLKYNDQSFVLENCSMSLDELGINGAFASDGYSYAVKNKIGLWGSWITHLGMLLLVIGFAAGQWMTQEYVVYGIPGSCQPVGDTGINVCIEDFNVDLRDDFTVEQYTADLSISDDAGNVVKGQASVNHPLSAMGLSFYQDSMGWANYVDIYKDGQLVKEDLICAGEYTYPDDLPNLVLLLNKFYPDFESTDEGMKSKTPLLNNPYSLYSIYFQDTMMAMDIVRMGDSIDIAEYSFILYDPVEYTLLVIKKDPTIALVAVSAAVLVIGLYLSFYCRPYEVWSDGQNVYAKADKAPQLLKQQLEIRRKKKDDN